mgnify:CR=1 FL=1
MAPKKLFRTYSEVGKISTQYCALTDEELIKLSQSARLIHKELKKRLRYLGSGFDAAEEIDQYLFDLIMDYPEDRNDDELLSEMSLFMFVGLGSIIILPDSIREILRRELTRLIIRSFESKTFCAYSFCSGFSSPASPLSSISQNHFIADNGVRS